MTNGGGRDQTAGIRGRTLSGLKWSGIGQFIRQVLQFGVMILLARILSPREFGLMGMIMVFVYFVQLFNEVGFGPSIIQKMDLKEEHLSSVFWVNLGVGFLLALFFMAGAPLIARFYDEPALKNCTRAISVNFIFGSLSIVQLALLQKEMKFKRVALIETTAVAVAGFSAIVMALRGFGVWSLVYQSVILTAVTSIMAWLFSQWRPDLRFQGDAVGQLWGYTANLLGFNTLNYCVRNMDKVLIGKYVGTAVLGLYSRAYALMLLPLDQVNRVISRVMFPALSALQHDRDRVKEVYLKATRCIAVVTFPVMVGLLVVAEPFILTLLGEQWAGAVPFLRVFCLVGIVQSVGTTVGWIYNSQGRTGVLLAWGAGSAAVYAVTYLIGLRWGAMGVAVSYCLTTYLILWYPAWRIPGSFIGLSFGEMLVNLRGPFCCAAAMGAGIWVLHSVLPDVWFVGIRLALETAFGMIFYFLAVRGSRLRAYREVLALLPVRAKTMREAPAV